MSTPLVKKLGLKDGMRAYVLEAPPAYPALLGDLPAGIHFLQKPEAGLDFIHYFARAAAALDTQFPTLKSLLTPVGMLWISWPKKSSPLSTDLNRDRIREMGLGHGLVDVKVCAVDADWSALKFVYRLKDR